MAASPTALTRPQAVRRARRLNRLTIWWNVAEAVVALLAGAAAGAAHRLHPARRPARDATDRAELRGAGRLRRSPRVLDLAGRAQPEASPAGIALTALSLAVMPVLARAKRRLAPAIGSRAVEAEAAQTSLCAVLSGVVLAGLAANAWLGWWWADPVAGLAVAGIALVEGVRTWRADQLTDTCCA